MTISNKKLVLWISGYNDYFFHTHLNQFNIFNDCDILPITPLDYNINSKNAYSSENYLEYVHEIDKIINKNINIKYEKIILYAHSTGALIALLYMIHGYLSIMIDKLILNDPFIDFNVSYFNKLIIKNIHLYPKTWYFENGFIKFNKNTCIIPKGISSYKENLNKIDYIMKNKLQINTNVPNINASFLIATSRVQNFIKQTNKPILENMNILVFVALGNNGVSKLNYLDTMKYIFNISNNIQIVKVNNAEHDVFVPNKHYELYNISKIINNYINKKSNKKKYNNKIIKKYDKSYLNGKIIILPNLLLYSLFLFFINYCLNYLELFN